jgi:hypothetical protein
VHVVGDLIAATIGTSAVEASSIIRRVALGVAFRANALMHLSDGQL